MEPSEEMERNWTAPYGDSGAAGGKAFQRVSEQRSREEPGRPGGSLEYGVPSQGECAGRKDGKEQILATFPEGSCHLTRIPGSLKRAGPEEVRLFPSENGWSHSAGSTAEIGMVDLPLKEKI